MAARELVVNDDAVVSVAANRDFRHELDFLFVEHQIGNRARIRKRLNVLPHRGIVHNCGIVHIYIISANCDFVFIFFAKNSKIENMAKTLVIGATCVDLIIHVKKFPETDEDINFNDERMTAGGTAFNVARALQSQNSEFILCSPIGEKGVYAEFIKSELAKNKIPIFAEVAGQENGVCICLINEKREHAFLCSHKAEYVFDEKFFSKINFCEIDSIYFSGLELEEANAENEIDFIARVKSDAQKQAREIKVFFDPTSRINFIKKNLVEKIFALNPILHLNKQEALDLSGKNSFEEAAAHLSRVCENDLILTLGKDGAYIFERGANHGKKVEGIAANVVSTIGCGDAHLGICIAQIKNGASLYDAVLKANAYAAKVAQTEKASI